VTCTDSAVFAGSQYPEKASVVTFISSSQADDGYRFANYGGSSVNAEYCHESGLRLVLNSLATCAARYGRYIEPLLSFSVDFYLRLFVRIHTGPAQVKDLPRSAL
jgi:tRNA (guanine26-N2/guanine27-N2)-dimethyltransferase